MRTEERERERDEGKEIAGRKGWKGKVQERYVDTSNSISGLSL